MGKENKYRMCMGFAFNEEKEMKMLSKMAKEGWLFYSFSKLGYNFKKGESSELIYCIDTNKLEDDEKNQYFALFREGGWTHICSYGNYYHFFSALPNTTPIYTDKETIIERYTKDSREIFKTVIILGLVFLISLGIENTLNSIWHNEVVSLIISFITGGSLGLLVVMLIAGIVLKFKIKKF